MDIPYTVEARRDTGLTNGKIGIWLFLASEVMLFGALFASYILIRTGAPSWPRGDTMLNVPLATLNTIVLISSSVTMVMEDEIRTIVFNVASGTFSIVSPRGQLGAPVRIRM